MKLMKPRRILSTLSIAVLIAGALLIPAGAAKAPPKPGDTCACGEVLQVWVDGFGQPLFYNEGTPDEVQQGPMRTDAILPALPAVLWNLAKAFVIRDFDPLAGSISDLAYGLLGHLQIGPDGKSVEPLTCHWVIDPQQDHKTEPEFWFRYDFRLDPFAIAAQLDDFIETLCERTGHGTVALTSHSEGGVVAMTYLKEYGAKRLNTLILANSGWQGLSLAGQLFTGNFALSGPAITAFVSNNDQGLLGAGMDLVDAAHLLDFAPYLGAAIKNTLLEPLFDKALVPLMATMPAVWTFVTDDDYEASKQVFKGDPQYDRLLAAADKYHYGVMLQAGQLVKKAQAEGVKVAVMCSYGNAPIPVTRDVTYHSDRLIDTALESGGATVAPIGETLPAGKSKYRSPDGIIDAATCILPDSTWFVKYNWHAPEPFEDLRQWIIHSGKQPTVFDNPAFPQYLRRAEDGRGVPLGPEPAPAPPGNLQQAAGQFAKALWDEIKTRAGIGV
jgi:pimeloyl-ACP methyl ester carboxylesterase